MRLRDQCEEIYYLLEQQFEDSIQTMEYDEKRQQQMAPVRIIKQLVETMRLTERQQKFAENRNKLDAEPTVNQPHNHDHNHVEPQDQNKLFLEEIERIKGLQFTVEDFDGLAKDILSEDITRKHHGIIGIRKLLSVEQNSPIDLVVSAGLVPRMLQFSNQGQYPQLQIESLWCLSNVASGTAAQTQAIVGLGGIPLFVKLTASTNLKVVEQSIWGLGNIASDRVLYRDAIIRQGGFNNIVAVINMAEEKQQSVNINYYWALTNLCKGAPLPKYSLVRDGIMILCKAFALGKLTDNDIKEECLWVIFQYSEGDYAQEQAEIFTEYEIVLQLVKELDYDNNSSLPSLKIIGNIVDCNLQRLKQVISYGFIDRLAALLGEGKITFSRQAIYILLNISDKEIIGLIVKSELLRPKIIELFMQSSIFGGQKICEIMANMVRFGNLLQSLDQSQLSQIIKVFMIKITSIRPKKILILLKVLECFIVILQSYKVNQFNSSIQVKKTKQFENVLQKLQCYKQDSICFCSKVIAEMMA